MFNAEIDQFKNDLILAEIEEEEEKKEKYYNNESIRNSTDNINDNNDNNSINMRTHHSWEAADNRGYWT